MATAVWPIAVSFIASPQSVKESGPDAVIRTPMSKGAAKTRTRFTGAPKPYSGLTDSMSIADTEVIADFHAVTLAMGALPFTATHPRTGVTETFRFLSPPEYIYEQNSDDLYRVGMSLEVMP